MPGIPSALAAAVMRCLEKNPDDRPASVRELMAVLSAVLPSLPPPVAEGDLAVERNECLLADPVMVKLSQKQ